MTQPDEPTEAQYYAMCGEILDRIERNLDDINTVIAQAVKGDQS